MGKALTLYELNSLVRETIELELNREYWVEAELSEVREVRGHCYMQLVQYERGNDGARTRRNEHTPIAQASAKCWQSSWQLIRPHFERVTGQRPHAGMKVLMQVYAQFHETYGFSWIVTDIDPTYTMGDMARKRQEIIQQLKEEGVFDLNKELHLPMFAQHIAVISSDQAAGYGDFVNQLESNEYGFRFDIQLFPAVMQGEKVEESIISALEQIYALTSHPSPLTSHLSPLTSQFDCVVIIRGGGATADLSGFDTLALAENVANFSLPVITGIGHERDESILDMVAHTSVKTPTAAAAFLIDHLKEVYDTLMSRQDTLVHLVRNRMEVENMRLERVATQIPMLFSVVRTRQEMRLDRLYRRFLTKMQQRIDTEKNKCAVFQMQCGRWYDRRLLRERHRLELLEQRITAVDPARLLQRGYSITLFQGRSVRDASVLKPGDEIETRVEKGSIRSVVK